MAIPQSTRAMGAIRTSVLLEVNLVDQLQVTDAPPARGGFGRAVLSDGFTPTERYVHTRQERRILAQRCAGL